MPANSSTKGGKFSTLVLLNYWRMAFEQHGHAHESCIAGWRETGTVVAYLPDGAQVQGVALRQTRK